MSLIHSATLCVVAGQWLTDVTSSLSQESLELLHRALLHDPDLEVSVRIMLKAGALVLEVSDGTRKTDLARIEVEPVRIDDGFGHPATNTKQ